MKDNSSPCFRQEHTAVRSLKVNNEQKAFERAAASSYEKLGSVMNAALTELIKVLEADGAVVRILNDDEVSEWEQITNFRDIQDKWVREKIEEGFLQDPEAYEVLEAVRTQIENSTNGK